MSPQAVIVAVCAEKLDELARAWIAAWKLPDRRRIYEWARTRVNLPPGIYKIPGFFQVERSRYLIEPFHALEDDRVRVVTALMPVRSGKTLLADVWMPWTFEERPGPFMWNMNVDTLARRHVRTRVLPLLRGTLPDLLPDDPRKCTGQEIIFKNGLPLYVQGPSIDNLQGVMVRNLVEDELWMRDEGRHQQAVGRLGDFEEMHASKMLCAGQAGIEDDDMDVEFKAGSQEEWMVPCLGCGEYFEPKSSGLREDGSRWGLIWGTITKTEKGEENDAKNKEGIWQLKRVKETVRYACPRVACKHEHKDADREIWNMRGRYEAKNPDAPETHRSFHVYATVTRRWDLLAEELAAALNALSMGISSPLMLYTQKRDALPWSESLLVDVGGGPKYTPGAEWKEEAYRILTVDHQADGLNWGLVVGMSLKGELRRYWFGKLMGEDDIKAKEAEYKLEKRRVFVDSKWEPDVVHGWCLRNDWIAMEGDARAFFIRYVGPKGKEKAVQKSYSAPIPVDPGKGTNAQGKRTITKIMWSNPAIKGAVKGLLDRGQIVEPDLDPNDENEKAYRKQMRGQWRRPVKNRVTHTVRWEWLDNGEDHARDCWNEAVVFAKIKRCLPDFGDVIAAGQEMEAKETPTAAVAVDA